jgi:hypothetical protein
MSSTVAPADGFIVQSAEGESGMIEEEGRRREMRLTSSTGDRSASNLNGLGDAARRTRASFLRRQREASMYSIKAQTIVT